jgi:hypothetical protein
MRNFFSIIVIFAVLLVGGGYVYMQKQEEERRVKRIENLSSVRRAFASKARDAANQEDDEAYVRQIKAALTSLEDDLKRTVYKDEPEARDARAYEKKVDEKFKEGELDEARRKSMLEGYEIVKDAYATLQSGNWRPILTKKGANDTRLDIYTMNRTTDDEGRPILEAKFFFWGIEDSTQVSWGPMTMRLWKKEMEKVKEGRKMVEKEVEKVLGRAEGESQPRIIIQRPSKYIDDFPSFVSVGSLWFPVLPTDAVYVDLEYVYSTRAGGGGGDIESVLKWEKLEIPRGWKLKEGQEWEADEIEATEDEIAGRSAEEEDAGTAP